MAQREAQVQGVLVEIFGEQYRIGGDPKQVQQVAAYVDAKMKEIAGERGGRMPKGQVAMLAAMEITAELFKVMSERKTFTDRAHESIERLTRLVEDRAHLADGVPRTRDVVGGRLRDRVCEPRAARLPSATPVE